ncbi:HNH endonuclease [Curtobacterium herbarum]|uniref:HNH endonuclease n=1 Tax=Curtobacterium herbarum TaxID=150122 RepID=UPI001C8E4520|nr:HNH endonuclease signature motif containing protein [Curtobacterium herbarum]MBY0178312.1 HNH endonuclease [Curtobacterium herbarum]
MPRPLAADPPLAAFHCGGCGVEYPTRMRNRKYCTRECWLLYLVARTGRCEGCHAEIALSFDEQFVAHVTGEWEAVSTAFAALHEGCRRKHIDESGRPVGCGCSACRRARGDAAPRLRPAPQPRTREVSPEFARNRPIVLERDGWVCQICQIPLDREALPFDDRAPAVDHIVRVTDGGGDELDKLHATHRWCNLRREHFLFGEDDLVAEAARARSA